MSITDAFQSPIETKNGHSINFTKERNGLGMVEVGELSFTNRYTSVILRGSEEQKATLRHILMTHEIGTETIAQAELREAALPKLSPLLAQYSGHVGLDDAKSVNLAMGNMGQGMVQRSLKDLHDFTHEIDNLMEGRSRAQFAAPKHEVDMAESPHHGGVPNHNAGRTRQV